MIIEKFKRLKTFHILIILLVFGLIYGATNLYMKIQFYKSFANQTRSISVLSSKVQIDSIQRIYPSVTTIESQKSFDFTSKSDGILNKIFVNESSKESKEDKLLSILSTSQVGEIVFHAPFDGYIGISEFKEGDKLKNGDILLTLDDLSLMKAYINLPEKVLPKITKPIKYLARSKLYPNEIYSGVIKNIDQRIDEKTRTVRAYAIIENTNQQLRPGLLMNIDIILEEVEGAILVPEEAILSSEDYRYVFIVSDDKAVLTKVNLGISNNGLTEVVSGLNPNDTVITMGHEKLKDGSKIKIVE